MRFFHVYNEECFEGLEKNGLINKDTGLKIQHCFSVPKERQFNQIARVNGQLYSILKENSFPFYVDRIAGGITYYPYAFDKQLIRAYTDLLGEDFLGFQLHESASNIRGSDWETIQEKMKSGGPYDATALERELKCDLVDTDGTVLYSLSHGVPSDYASLCYPKTYAEFAGQIQNMFINRLRETDNKILPVDSYYMFTKMQNDLGMNVFMPEVGFQIPLMRQQIALARGIAKAAGKSWGAYYECWRVYEEDSKYYCCMPCYNLDPINEWYLTQQTHLDDFTTHGENGGSSRRLQNRIYYYALMSGAEYFSEEWGLNCSYTDMKEFTLSAYGETKKAFIHAAEDIQGVCAEIPFAIVLPKEYSCMELPTPMDTHKLGEHRNTYMRSQLSFDEKEYFGHIEDVLKLFFARDGKVYGNEGHVITNSRFGDIADIIYEDASDEALCKYKYLIDATRDSSFSKAKAGRDLVILESTNLEQLADKVSLLVTQTMPVYVDALCWLVSKDSKGRSFLSIFNNEGNDRSSAYGDIVNHNADKRVKITFNVRHNIRVFKYPMGKLELTKVDENSYYATIPAADFLILEY